MSNKNYTPQSAGEKAEKARKFAAQLEGKSWATKNASQSDAVCNMFVDSYRDALIKSIRKAKHPALFARKDELSQNKSKAYNPLYAHMKNSFAVSEEITYQQSALLQEQGWLGKHDKKLIANFLESCNSYLIEIDKATASSS